MRVLESGMGIVQLFTNPKETVDKLVSKNRICYEEIALMIILITIYRCFILEYSSEWLIVRYAISVLIVALVHYIGYSLCGGECTMRLMINLSICIHVMSLIGKMTLRISFISIISIVIVELLVVYYQYILNKVAIKAKEQIIKRICVMELIIIFFWTNYQLMTQIGRYVVYSERVQFFPIGIK